jgi:cytochrome d ubiquinol oxidase subunit II
MASGFALLGSTWLIIKTTDELQRRAITWAKRSIVLLAIGVAGVSLATPLVSERIYEKWFGLENLIVLWPIPAMTAVTFLIAYRSLSRLPAKLDEGLQDTEWIPFASTVAIFMLAFHGLAYSLFPYVVMDKLTIWEAASAPESLMFIFVGAIIVLPVIVGYSVYAYRVFRGKATDLSYY